MSRLALIALSLQLLAPESTTPAWQVLREGDPAAGTMKSVAFTVNADGYELAVESLAAARGVRCTFALPEQAGDVLDRDDLPVLEVDARVPQQIARWEPSDEWEDGGDFVEVLRREMSLVPLVHWAGDRVVFECWQPLPRQQTPTRGLLRQLLDGRELIVRFDLADGEYGEAVFSLAGAREAIAEALDMPVAPSRRDILQDELLAFRVDYRKTTCYLLGGAKAEKRRKRCLEAVEACRGRDHDSVVSMLGCVEGE
ncbi:MAG: hypothetical protein R3244_07870 [Thermoanaerobaculia bacterium]|nr:hypothetical protein [Thermoanaerobaculia bacterium]